MTRHPRNKSRARLLRSLYMWHRWLGLAAAAFVILLSLSGLLLNHTEEFALDSRHVSNGALLVTSHNPRTVPWHTNPAPPRCEASAGSILPWSAARPRSMPSFRRLNACRPASGMTTIGSSPQPNEPPVAHNPRTIINVITAGNHFRALDLVILSIICLAWLVATSRK